MPKEAARPCTRVEITLKNRQPFSGVEFGVAGLAESESADLPELSETLRIYLDMLEHILLLGGDVDGHLRKINYRSRLKLEPHLYGAVVKNLRIKAVEVQDRISPRKVERQDGNLKIKAVETQY